MITHIYVLHRAIQSWFLLLARARLLNLSVQFAYPSNGVNNSDTKLVLHAKGLVGHTVSGLYALVVPMILLRYIFSFESAAFSVMGIIMVRLVS